MSPQLLLVLDFGTSGIKSMIFAPNGKLHSHLFTPIQYQDSDGLSGIGKEFDASAVWKTFCDMIPRSLKETKCQPDDILGIAATSQRHGAVFLDKKGAVLYSGPNLDARGVFVQDAVVQDLANVCPATGCWPPLLYSLCRLLWYKRERPKLFAQISHVLSISDWLVYQLTGEVTTDPSQASNTQFMDIKTSSWASEILDLVGITEELLPPIVEPGTVVGNVSVAAHKSTGLSKSSIVGIGGADTQCALLGSAAIDAGDVSVVAGNTAPVQLVTAKPIIDPQRRLWTGRFVLPRRWVLEANTGTTGSVLRWFVQNMIVPLCPELEGQNIQAFKQIDKLASEAKPGALDTFALLGPAIMDASDLTTVRPCLFLFPPPASPIVTPISIRDITRALLENIWYAIRTNLNLVQDLAATSLEDVTVTGGMARSNFWLQMLADVTGLRVKSGFVKEASGLGAAICAAKAVGLFPSLTVAMQKMVVLQPEVAPRDAIHANYETYFTRWQALYKQSANL
ncbi:MAG: FGGY-family carbohydrate kinase [Candidatus Thorarchaeota archaeon]